VARFSLRIEDVTPATGRERRVVLLIGAGASWPDELMKLLPDGEWAIERLSDLEEVPGRLARGQVCAILTTPRQWSGRELALLRECRARAPETAYLVMAEDPAAPDLKRAFEHGATAFVRWPSSPEVVLRAILGTPEPAPSGRGHNRRPA
jgi:DNA-binding NarL/FixJ family response regulator